MQLEQDKTDQNRSEQNRTDQNRPEQNRTDQIRAERIRTEQNRSDRTRSDQIRTDQNRTYQIILLESGFFKKTRFFGFFIVFIKKPKKGANVYNLGGGRENSCSILEAINLIEQISKKKSKYKILGENRKGDHIWWISDNSKFKKDYPNWRIKISLKQSLEQMIKFEQLNK